MRSKMLKTPASEILSRLWANGEPKSSAIIPTKLQMSSLGSALFSGKKAPKETIDRAKTETCVKNGSLINMKTLSLITAGFFLVLGTVVSNGAPVTRISDETGFSVDTLQAERTSTGLGWGELENAHLLANALAANGSSLTFNDLVAMHQAGEGWGKIAHDNGLNLGRIVSAAHRSSNATLHAQNTQTMHGKSSSIHGRSGHTQKTHRMSNTAFGRSHAGKMGRSSFGSSSRGATHMTSHGMGGMGHGGHGH
jgi:hypothetical protein